MKDLLRHILCNIFYFSLTFSRDSRLRRKQSFQMARLCARCPCHVDAELCKAALGVMLQHLQRLKKEKKKKATNAQGTLLMTWMDTTQWLMNEHQPGHLYTCAHISTHLNWHMFICVADMARWCNPLLSPGFHIFPLLCWDYAVVQSDFAPLSSNDVRWMAEWWVGQAGMQ